MTGPLEKVDIICPTCVGDGWVIEKEYEKGKTYHQAISVRVICQECNGLGKVQAHKFVRTSEKTQEFDGK